VVYLEEREFLTFWFQCGASSISAGRFSVVPFSSRHDPLRDRYMHRPMPIWIMQTKAVRRRRIDSTPTQKHNAPACTSVTDKSQRRSTMSGFIFISLPVGRLNFRI
jgi:hypothetical protein